MKRAEAIKYIAEDLEDELVICNLGFPSQELYSVKDESTHFYMLGSIGLASSIGLGLALSTERKVVVLDGDGSLFYNLGSLITIATQKPENLYWIVLDNQSHGSTGFQQTYDPGVTSIEQLSLAAGFKRLITASNREQLKEVVKQFKQKGPLFVIVKIEKGNAKVSPVPFSPEKIKLRFMEEVKKG